MRINRDRLWRNLQEIGGIGADEKGGYSRFAWSTEYRQACIALQRFAEHYDLEWRMDTVGNVLIRLPGREAELPAILTGSHLDTVPQGGGFDGIAGIVSSLEVLACMRENQYVPRRSIEVAAFINEEATQFLGGTFGSRAMCGMIAKDYPDTCRNHHTGQTLREAMTSFGMGLDPDRIHDSCINPACYHCFIELHIEQGRFLLDKNLPLAIVTDIAGIQQMYVDLEGEACHAGGMAMHDRHDTLMAAANIACEAERLALHSGGRDTRATVGYIHSKPGVHNIVPEKTEIPIDFREDQDEIWTSYFEKIAKFIDSECSKRGVKYEIVKTLELKPAHCSKEIISIMNHCADDLKIPHTEMVSYPCHDAVNFERIMPIGMIFLRSSNGGVSHCPQEYTTQDDLEMGANLLLHTLINLTCS